MKSRVLAVDVGTMFLQVAEKDENGKIHFKVIRNAFAELDNYNTEDVEEVLSKNSWQYVKDKGSYYVVGEDSFKISLVFPNIKLRRSMQDGVLNKNEDKKMLVMAKMIELLVGGNAPDDKSLICFCTSGESIDNEVDDKFHSARLQSMFNRLNWKTKRISEGLAVVLGMRPTMIESDGTEIPFTGLGLSFGSGKVNACLAYKGLEIISISATKSGDFIDKMVHENTNIPLSKITHIKENQLDFNTISESLDNDVLFCLDIYYKNILEYALKNFSVRFDKVKSDFPGDIDIVIGGGTSSPPGFEKKVKEVVSELSLPFRVKEIRVDNDPRNVVVRGLLSQAIITQKKLSKKNEFDKLDEMLE